MQLISTNFGNILCICQTLHISIRQPQKAANGHFWFQKYRTEEFFSWRFRASPESSPGFVARLSRWCHMMRERIKGGRWHTYSMLRERIEKALASAVHRALQAKIGEKYGLGPDIPIMETNPFRHKNPGVLILHKSCTNPAYFLIFSKINCSIQIYLPVTLPVPCRETFATS